MGTQGGAQQQAGGTVKKGDVRKANGREYKWMGALWVDTGTNKPIGIEASVKAGLSIPNIDPNYIPRLRKILKWQKQLKAALIRIIKWQKLDPTKSNWNRWTGGD